MEVPGPGIETKELQRHWILNPLCGAGDGTNASNRDKPDHLHTSSQRELPWLPAPTSFESMLRGQGEECGSREILLGWNVDPSLTN